MFSLTYCARHSPGINTVCTANQEKCFQSHWAVSFPACCTQAVLRALWKWLQKNPPTLLCFIMYGKWLPAAAPDFPSRLQGFTCVIRMEESCYLLSDTIWGHPCGEGLEGDEHCFWGFALMRWTRRKQLLVHKKLETGRSKTWAVWENSQERKSAVWVVYKVGQDRIRRVSEISYMNLVSGT